MFTLLCSHRGKFMKPFEFRWKNFRCFENTGWIDIKPLTIFIGPNNSGKTSLITPLLLMKQSLESLDPEAPLKIKGEYVNLGSYKQFVTNHDISSKIEFEIRFLQKKILKGDKKPRKNDLTRVKLIFREGRGRIRVKLHTFEVESENGLFIRRTLKKNSKNYSLTVKKQMDTGKYERINYTDDTIENILLSHKPHNFLFFSQEISDNLRVYQDKKREEIMKFIRNRPFTINENVIAKKFKEQDRISNEIYFYTKPTNEVSLVLQDILERIDYVGPLRDKPERVYEISGDRPQSVGPTGKYAPEILYIYKRKYLKKVNDWLEEFNPNVSVNVDGSFAEGTLKLNLVTSIKIKSKNGKTPKNKTISSNLTDSGFGYSQLLPIIIQGLYTPKHDLLIYEQPEIHLNPQYQSKLADFFSYLATKENKYVVIETHSEHILMRIRTLIAKREIDTSDVRIYYVERKDDKSTITNIPIQLDGHIEDTRWPKGFFDESLSESLELAWNQEKFHEKIDTN